MKQHELIMEYVKEFGAIVPAKVGGRIYHMTMFGSEVSKRCRELRAAKKLVSHGEGKFEVFLLPPTEQLPLI